MLEWFLHLTLFGRLHHSTVCQLFCPVFIFSFPSISLVLQPEVKSRMRPSYCIPSCDVTKLADRTSRVRRKLGSNTRLSLALYREFQIFKKQSIFFCVHGLKLFKQPRNKISFHRHFKVLIKSRNLNIMRK